MDCNWCPFCSKHFHSENQSSLYCSEECRKSDALACCAYHQCDHPDDSSQHDHLTFCHHHRPAIRIPSFALNLSPSPSQQQSAHGQYQADEWSRFLQQQYSYPYPSHAPMAPTRASAHTSPKPSFPPQHGRPNSKSTWSDAQDSGAVMEGMMDSLSNMVLCETECDQPCVSRKKKTLPPPTLSPTLPPTISNPASLSPTALSSSDSGKSGIRGMSDCSSSNGSMGQGQDNLSPAWPKMDTFFFPDHCCRTAGCRPVGDSQTRSKQKSGPSKKPFISELPPPPAYQRDGDNGQFATMSASIWGQGWHQVEPLEASLVKTVQKSNLAGYGYEREPRCRQRSRGQGGHHACPEGRAYARQQPKQQSQANKLGSGSPSSWATVCTSRLPRSLQFVE